MNQRTVFMCGKLLRHGILNEEVVMKWWGYIHTSGSIQVKRYFGPLDIQEAEESEFCKEVYGPFDATDRQDAIKVIELGKTMTHRQA